MNCRISPMLGCIVFVATVLCSTAGGAEEKKETGRPGLALTMKLDGKVAKITIALDYLTGAKDQPKDKGVRQYTYDVPIGAVPTQVGWSGGKESISVLLHGQKLTFMAGLVDRQENGSLCITQEGDKEIYRIRGVYHYMEQLFVIDDVIKVGEPLLQYEQPTAAK
jgi:hypothetical protein